MAVASLANRVQVNTNCGNNDALYGPYNSTDEALTLIPSALINGAGAIGRTIGVIESGKVVEYWWQPVDDGYGFVKKGAVEIVVDDELNAYSTNPVQNNVITGAIDELKTKVVEQKSSAIILPNALNVWEEAIISSVTITKGGSNTDTVNHYMIRYTAGDGGQIIFDTSWGNLKWYGGDKPEWVIGCTYEISIVDSIALWVEIEG